MKISNANNLTPGYAGLSIRTKGLSSSSLPKNDEKSFDAISIQSEPRQIAERTFAAAISKELASDVRIPVSDARLNELKEQISSHTYKIDASAIASRMLLRSHHGCFCARRRLNNGSLHRIHLSDT